MPIVNKAHILCSLKEYWNSHEVFTSGSEYQTFTLEMGHLNLARLCLHVREKRLIYRRSKEGDEFLALGEIYRHGNSNERQRTEQILKSNPSLKLYFCARFDNEGIRAPEWAHFGSELGIIPFVEWIAKKEKSILNINFNWQQIKCPKAQAEFLFRIEELLDLMPENQVEVEFKSMSEVPSEQVWCKAIDEIAQKLSYSDSPQDPDKVVMARKKVLRANKLIDPQSIFKEMLVENQIGHIFFIKIDDHRAFLSFTPERLFYYHSDTIKVDVIAGTRPRGATVDEDHAFAQDLMNSPKELEEHRIVASDIERKLKLFCREVRPTAKEELLRLNHVQHIKGSYEGSVATGIGPFEIMNGLHPTPAVGGRPWPAAKAIINQYERFDRGLYAGPCGLISDSYTDLMVGIRSIVIYQDEIHIYGGAGIVAGSKGRSEWIETHNKMKNFKLQLS